MATKSIKKKPAAKKTARNTKTGNTRKKAEASAKSVEKKENQQIIVQVDEVTRAIMEQLIGSEQNRSSDENDAQISALKAMIESLSDDLRRCNERIDELESRIKRDQRRRRTGTEENNG